MDLILQWASILFGWIVSAKPIIETVASAKDLLKPTKENKDADTDLSDAERLDILVRVGWLQLAAYVVKMLPAWMLCYFIAKRWVKSPFKHID